MGNPMRVECTHCLKSFRVKSSGAIGKTVVCPKCSEKFVIARPEPEPKKDPFLEDIGDDIGESGDDIRENRRARRRNRAPRLPQDVHGKPNTAFHEPVETPLALPRPQLRRLRKRNKPSQEEEFAEESSWLLTGFPLWIIGGCIGSLFGVGAWVLVGYVIHLQIGWLAVGVGLMVGLGVRVAAGEHDGVAPGIVAAVITVLAILVAKFLVAMFLAAWLASRVAGIPQDVETLSIQQIADEIVDERIEAGQDVDWPEQELDFDGVGADISADYPPDIWQDATQRWEATPIAEQQARREEAEKEKERAEENQDDVEGWVVGVIFLASFGVLDLIWFPLAAFTAFQMGANIAEN